MMRPALVSSIAALLAAACTLQGQSRRAQPRAAPIEGLPDPSVVKAFIAMQVQKDWTPPKTPWGDPDIQGNFTTKDEANTPFERPEKWAGRRIQDISAKEMADEVIARQKAAIEYAPFAGGGTAEEGVAIGVPIHWLDNLSAANSRPWFVIDPPDGKLPPMTPEAKARPSGSRGTLGGARTSYTDRNLADRCIAFGAWRLPAIYGNSYQIVQTPDYVVLRQEQVHEARIVPLDGRPALDSKIRSYLGDGRGYWDGNTLVVVTTNFTPQMAYAWKFNDWEQPMGKVRIIERFTRIAPKKVEWTMTFDDPSIWTRSWSYSLPMTEDDGQAILEYACHEGNYGLANMLSAGRAEDRQIGRTR